MRYFFVIAVLVGILFQSFHKAAILLSFEMNKDYIAKNLCVKKKVKNNCCKGSCKLKKDLREADKKEQAPAASASKHKVQLFCEALRLPSVQAPCLEMTHTFAEPCNKPVSIPLTVFHPPPAVSTC